MADSVDLGESCFYITIDATAPGSASITWTGVDYGVQVSMSNDGGGGRQIGIQRILMQEGDSAIVLSPHVTRHNAARSGLDGYHPEMS